MSGNDFQGLSVLFVHGEHEHREHDDNHGKSRQTDIAGAFDQKENGQPNQGCRTEADKLSFGQIEKHLGFDPRKVTRDGNICCQSTSSFPLVCAEYGFRKTSGLEQGETQKNRVAHDTPDGADDVAAERNGLYQYRIDTDTDDN